MGQSEYELEAYAAAAVARFNIMTDVEDIDNVLPADFALHQNYPNPFNPATVISFDIERSTEVELSVFNSLGRKIKTLFDEHAAAGSYDVVWDGTDSKGHSVPSGVYFYVARIGASTQTGKMMLLK